MTNTETLRALDERAQDLRRLIVMDTQFGWIGETTLDLPSIERLVARGWVAEGDENCEYDITVAGRLAIEQALSAGDGVAEGFVVVPREPTEEMKVSALHRLNPLGALVDWQHGSDEGATRPDVTECWNAMLAAAPAAPVVFTNDGNEEQRFIEHESLSCPHCGGSGHRDDVASAPVAEGEIIHVNVIGGDVFEAPLKATGFADGIHRFVVTIPAQIANDEDRAIANAYRRWVGMTKPEDLNEPFAEFVRATVDFIAEHSRSSKAAAPEVEVDETRIERDRLLALINNPETEDFDKGVPLEAAHQVERWGTEHDAGKEPQDWLWLLGYLAGKALRAHLDGDAEKAKHHTISSAAVLRNWHAAITTGASRMRPGIDGAAALGREGGSHD